MQTLALALTRWLPTAAVLAALTTTPLLAQKLDIEKFQDVSSKAKRGYLEDVKVDNAAGKIDLRFITKSTTKEVASQTYHFNTKYELLGVDEVSIPMEKVKGYRGENYSKEAITIEATVPGTGFAALAAMTTPPGTILIRRRRIDYKWSWLGGGYRKRVKLLETIKPKTEAGGGFHYLSHVDDDATGGSLVLASENVRLTNVKGLKIGLHLLHFTKDAELDKDTYLDTDVAQSFVEMGAVGLDTDEEADDSGKASPDVAIMLAYTKGMGKTKGLHPATEYQYLRVGTDGTVKEKIRVDAPVSAWLVNGFIPMTDGGVLLYGPANAKTDDYYAEALPTPAAGLSAEESFKAKNFVLGKIIGGKVAWLTKTDLKEFEAKQQVPPGQKRTPDYTGKRFAINLAYETPNGDIFVGGQNFKARAGSAGGNKFLNTLTGTAGGYAGPTRSYGDMLLFHFSSQGQLRAQYGVRRAENNATASMAPTAQFMRSTADGKAVYWTFFEIDGWRTVTGLTDEGSKGGLFDPTERETISYPSVTRIDLGAATIGPQKAFGVTKEGKYYVSNIYSTLPVGASTKQIVFFGENKKGSTMWFGQLPLE